MADVPPIITDPTKAGTQTYADLYSHILAILGVPADQIGKAGYYNGIPTSSTTPRDPKITVANTWGKATEGQLPGWASAILGTASSLSPDEQKKLYKHWVNKEGVQSQWADIAAARPAWAQSMIEQMLAPYKP